MGASDTSSIARRTTTSGAIARHVGVDHLAIVMCRLIYHKVALSDSSMRPATWEPYRRCPWESRGLAHLLTDLVLARGEERTRGKMVARLGASRVAMLN